MSDDIEFNPADLSWPEGEQARAAHAIIYQDRPLTTWEWIKVYIFRRPDPRPLAWVDFDDEDKPPAPPPPPPQPEVMFRIR